MKARDIVMNKVRKDMCCCQTVYMNMVCFSYA
ncbi:Uncharacterised protein [uncultured Clostridium sp.]|jgi:hypothetical protein|nr:Uncharacterised protein [uncultured Clostridium sp.]